MKNLEQPKPINSAESEKHQQKLQNYEELIQKRLGLIKTVGANKVSEEERSFIKGYNDVTAYWDMQKDIRELRAQLDRTPQEDEHLGNLINNLERYKHSVLFHDILDHILNGQTTIEISDKNDNLAENIIGLDIFTSSLDIKDFSKKTSQISIAHLFLRSKDMLILLNNTNRQLVQSMLNKFNNSKITKVEFIEFLRSSKNTHILQEAAENFSRIQVLRGLIALALQSYNLAYTKAIREGNNLENNKVLDGLEYFASNRIGELNSQLRSNPESFNSYQDYQSSYPDDNSDSYEDRLRDMRANIYSEIQKIFDDPDFENLTRQKLKEQKKTDSLSQ